VSWTVEGDPMEDALLLALSGKCGKTHQNLPPGHTDDPLRCQLPLHGQPEPT
jgi:hypothetical protein